MSVTLIGVTTPRVPEVTTAEQLLAYCARVSSSANQLKHSTGSKLIKYLLSHQEWSPLEMVSLTMEIETTRDIGRQILRHRSFSFQEFSQRYAEVREEGPVYRECRLQDTRNRQNSLETDDDDLDDYWGSLECSVFYNAMANYKEALARGIAKEVARALLPEGLITTRMYVQGTLRSWYHYCQLRMKPETQKEHRQIAEEAWGIVVTEFPSLKE